MKKIAVGFVIILVLALAVVFFNRNLLARFIIVNGIKNTCGLGVNIKGLNIGLPNVSITGLKIYNPAGFKSRLLADIPEIYVDFDLPAFFKHKVHLGKLKIEIKELDVILNEKGKLNVNSLALLAPKPGTGKPPEIKIDELVIKIGRVAYAGYFPVVGVKSKEFDPNIDETFHNVTDPSKVAAQLMQRILARIGIENLANNLTGIPAASSSDIGAAAQSALDQAKQGLSGIFK